MELYLHFPYIFLPWRLIRLKHRRFPSPPPACPLIHLYSLFLFSFFCFNLPSAEHFIIFVTFFLVRDLCTHFYVYYFSSSASSASFSPSFLYHRNIIVVAFRALSSLSLHFCVSAACPLCSNPFLCHCLLFLEVSLSVYICSKYHLLKQFNLGKRDMHWFRR